jgi:hypothetical protein
MYIPDLKLGKYKTAAQIPLTCVEPANTHTPVPTHTPLPWVTYNPATGLVLNMGSGENTNVDWYITDGGAERLTHEGTRSGQMRNVTAVDTDIAGYTYQHFFEGYIQLHPNNAMLYPPDPGTNFDFWVPDQAGMPKKIHTQYKISGFPSTIVKRILCDVAEGTPIPEGMLPEFTGDGGELRSSSTPVTSLASIGYVDAQMTAFPTPIIYDTHTPVPTATPNETIPAIQTMEAQAQQTIQAHATEYAALVSTATWIPGTYVNVAGDTMSGALTVSAGVTGTTAGFSGGVTVGHLSTSGGVTASNASFSGAGVFGSLSTSGASTLGGMVVDASGNVSGMGTLGCGSITSTGAVRANSAFNLNGTDWMDGSRNILNITSFTGGPISSNGLLNLYPSVTTNPSAVIRNNSYNSSSSSGTVHVALGYSDHWTKAIEYSKTNAYTSDLLFYTELGYNNPVLGLQLISNPGTPLAYFPGNVGAGTSNPQEDVHAADTVRADTAFNMNGTDWMDSSRNLTNIGTVGCGAITTSGLFTGDKITLFDETDSNVFTGDVYGDFIFSLLGGVTGAAHGKQMFSVRNNSTVGVYVNTQNSIPLHLGVSSGTSAGSITSMLEVNTTGVVVSGAATVGNLTSGAATFSAGVTGTTAGFSGQVTVPTPSAAGNAVNKGYADATYVDAAGDTMLGPLTLTTGQAGTITSTMFSSNDYRDAGGSARPPISEHVVEAGPVTIRRYYGPTGDTALVLGSSGGYIYSQGTSFVFNSSGFSFNSPATVTSIYIDATPTPVIPVAGVTLIFKGGVCTGVNP